VIKAVVFDLDGVLIDSEATWSAVRQQFVEEHGGRWHVDAQRDMMGMSSPEWSRYMHDRLGVGLAPERISDDVTASVAAQYHRRVPLLPGATETVSALAVRWPLGLASSANRSLIELVLKQTQLERHFVDSVSSEEVARGKPAPDVYLEAARRLRIPPQTCVAVEDSTNGIQAAVAAAMRVIVIPNRDFPPDRHVLARANRVLGALGELRPDVIEALDTVEGRNDAR
jgi:HAD superfamily hydrolase (TIGR01509 family)